MGLFRLFRSKKKEANAANLYSEIVARAREPVFYIDFGVPDTVEGRFDMIALHAFLILWRLKIDRPKTARLSQSIFDRMFVDMDGNLREMGVGDLSVGTRIKKMAKSFYGRTAAYEAGLDKSEEELILALQRNLYGNSGAKPDMATAMARYVMDQAGYLKELDLETILSAGTMLFAPIAIRDETEANR